VNVATFQTNVAVARIVQALSAITALVAVQLAFFVITLIVAEMFCNILNQRNAVTPHEALAGVVEASANGVA